MLTRLYSMNGGYHLRLVEDGTVEGSRLEDDIYSVLELKAVSAGVVVIRGVEAGLYLSMGRDGRLLGSASVTDESHFLESMEENHYNTYESQLYRGWYVGIKKNGKTKNGSRTHIGQKAIFFLPRRVQDSPNEEMFIFAQK
ncbi:putative fibroblast growth factor 1 [Engraulis encrasicolus]|uniref:putative fibroblast growth factor 1 n=1 Tax=Engraulis encrasicolus TaxID=184585 RepID=UPI002FD24212